MKTQVNTPYADLVTHSQTQFGVLYRCDEYPDSVFIKATRRTLVDIVRTKNPIYIDCSGCILFSPLPKGSTVLLTQE